MGVQRAHGRDDTVSYAGQGRCQALWHCGTRTGRRQRAIVGRQRSRFAVACRRQADRQGGRCPLLAAWGRRNRCSDSWWRRPWRAWRRRRRASKQCLVGHLRAGVAARTMCYGGRGGRHGGRRQLLRCPQIHGDDRGRQRGAVRFGRTERRARWPKNTTNLNEFFNFGVEPSFLLWV